ncbi:MAG: HEAT repeat domain-containing protein [Acidobacteriota bacterium]|nr:HEAT repeat domain-containing protein [Acidobacteriota bacterium]
MIRLGDKDATWWDYLAKRAEEAVDSDAPSVVDYDPAGKVIPGVSAKFLTWAKVHSLSVNQALRKTELNLAAVAFVGESMDWRGVPLLRQALLSPNYLVEMAAARGLAQLQDSASIPSIVQACETAPTEVAFGIASGLREFHTPAAENAAKRFTPQANEK